MYFVKIVNDKAVLAQTEYPGNDEMANPDVHNGWENRNDWREMADAECIANQLNELAGYTRFLATDAGEHTSPRYDICEAPKVGAEVSKSFNGDSYPEGTIVSTSKSFRVIKTSTGLTFYRRRLTGAWINNNTWSLIEGHHDERNPSF